MNIRKCVVWLCFSFLHHQSSPIGVVAFLLLLRTEGSFQLVPIATLNNANETAAS